MFKTKCGKCGAKYDYDQVDAGSTIKCDCGSAVLLPLPEVKEKPAKKESFFCTACLNPIAVGDERRWGLRTVCDACWRRLAEDAEKAKTMAALPPPEAAAVKAHIAAQVPVPNYGALDNAASLITVVGVVQIVLGCAGFVLIAAGGAGAGLQASIGASLAVLLTGVLGGIVTIGFGQLLFCIRDMAINSFHLRNARPS